MSPNDDFASLLWLAPLLMGLLCSCTSSDTAATPANRMPMTQTPTAGSDVLQIALVEFALPVNSAQPAFNFGIGKYEITNRQYQAFVQDTGYDGQDHPSSKRTEPFLNHFTNGRCPEDQAEHPACSVNWWHAKAYCAWLSKKIGKPVRLPTAQEWLFVAAGEEKRTYAWGNDWDPKRCNWSGTEDGFAKSAPVGSFANGCTPEGVHDMSGNIWEWCEDKVLRGGPWCLDRKTVTTSFASREDMNRADDKFGFRIVVLPKN